MFELTKDLRTNIEAIDNQHAELIRMCNHLEELCELPEHVDKYDELIMLVNGLKAYTEEHFAFEEKFLISIGYRKCFSHHAIHKEFIDKINELEDYDIDKDQNGYARMLARAVAQWILVHIAKEDMQYAEFYHSKK